MQVSWSRVMEGRAVEGGRVVEGVGIVFVNEKNEQDVAGIGEASLVVVDLTDVTNPDSEIRQWSIKVVLCLEPAIPKIVLPEK